MPEPSRDRQPTSFIQFKRLQDESLEDEQIPELPANRKSTDIKWLYALLASIVLHLPFLCYTLAHSDIERIFTGYDKCGNVCGKNNYKTENIPCSGANMTNYPFLQSETNYVGLALNFDSDLSDKTCVESCASGQVTQFGRCSEDQSTNEFRTRSLNYYFDNGKLDNSQYGVLAIYLSKWKLVTTSVLLVILISIGVLLLFRYATDCIVWSILIGCFLLLLIFDISCWSYFFNENASEEFIDVTLYLAILIAILTLIVGIILIWCRRKINLVVKILKECTRPVFDMPGLTLVPVVGFSVYLALYDLFVVATGYLLSAGILTELSHGHYVYVKNAVMVFAIIFNILVYYWLANVCACFQYFIIAGAVSRWYFIRDKTYLQRPILTSVIVMFKYHLGSLALGSLIILIANIMRRVIVDVLRRLHLHLCFGALMNALERGLLYLSGNALMVVAIHGQPFYKSGKRAAKLIVANLPNIVAVNYIVDFVLIMTLLLIAFISTLLAGGISTCFRYPLEVSDMLSHKGALVAMCVVACSLIAVLRITIEALLICYCEDNVLNDGTTKPYFMSRNLKQYVQEIKLLNEPRKCF